MLWVLAAAAAATVMLAAAAAPGLVFIFARLHLRVLTLSGHIRLPVLSRLL